MGRRSAGFVELNHTLCLLQGAEELGAPLALVVRGLVANFDFHGVLGRLVLTYPTGSGVRIRVPRTSCRTVHCWGFMGQAVRYDKGTIETNTGRVAG